MVGPCQPRGGEAERETIQHIFDTFKVDCGLVTSEPLPYPPGICLFVGLGYCIGLCFSDS